MQILNKIAVSTTEPPSTDVLWIKPVKGGMALYIFDGLWKALEIVNTMGTATPDDDVPLDAANIPSMEGLNSTTQQDEKFYPISITPGIIDTTRNQRLNATLADIEDKADSALRAIAYPEVVTIAIDPDTGIISAVIEDNSNNSE